MKKVFITGTRKGLGAALEQAFQARGWLVEGLNRPKYDLAGDLEPFVKNDFDVYILNSHHKYSQVNLLYRLFAANADREAKIIAIGSVSADGDRKQINEYAIEKKALDAAVTQLQLVESKCAVMQIKLGHLDTDRIAHLDKQKMSPKKIGLLIEEFCSRDDRDIYIKTLTVDLK